MLHVDVTGLRSSPEDGRVQFRPGPIMAQVVLADEINRASRRRRARCSNAWRAARRSTASPTRCRRRSSSPPEPDRVRGHVRLPEARSTGHARLRLGYPKPMEEIVISTSRSVASDRLGRAGAGPEDLREMQAGSRRSTLTRLWPSTRPAVRATREHPDVYLGASPRGSLNLYRASRRTPRSRGATRDPRRRQAAGGGRPGTPPHREKPASLREVDPEQIVKEILASVPVAEAAEAAEANRAQIS